MHRRSSRWTRLRDQWIPTRAWTLRLLIGIGAGYSGGLLLRAILAG